MIEFTRYGNFEYRDLALEAASNYLPEASEQNTIHEALLAAGFREILLEYVGTDQKPFFKHPGDEYIIGTLIDISESNKLANYVNLCTEIEITQRQALKHMSELINNLETEYGEAGYETLIGTFTPRSTSPPVEHEEYAKEFTPGDGLFREYLSP